MPNPALKKAEKILAERRQRALALQEENLEKLERHADWRECRRQIREVTFLLAFEENDALQKQMDVLKEKEKDLLTKYGMTEEDLAAHYVCEKCNDTGYVGGKKCVCLKKELTAILFSESHLNENFTFENCREDNEHNLAVYKKCRMLCQNTDVGGLRNVLLTGKTGTGKTYLCTAMAAEYAKGGSTVLFLTAHALNSTFLNCHLADIAEKNLILENLTGTDVLIIDDLGTENLLRNVTKEYLFLVLNEREIGKKTTVVCTNLSLAELRERYEDRIFDRLANPQTTFIARLEGKNKRTSAEKQ